MTVKNMHSDLDISLFQVKNWEEILGEEFYMTNPLVRYILLAILLLVLFLRTLSWLQYLYLKRELKNDLPNLFSIFPFRSVLQNVVLPLQLLRQTKSVTQHGRRFLLSHYFQPPQIATGDILEDAESEFRDYGQYMVEYVRLNAFVGHPVFHGREK